MLCKHKHILCSTHTYAFTSRLKFQAPTAPICLHIRKIGSALMDFYILPG